ncbi:MAG: type IV toxin-antitoxin system AbiEi family antitoxin domain-containing protein [Mycobacteriaceae bacterium]
MPTVRERVAMTTSATLGREVQPMSTCKVAPRNLVEHLLLERRTVVTLPEICALTGLAPKPAADAVAMLRRSRRLFSPYRGLHGPVPLGYRRWGAPPATDFIDSMMAALGREYYVSLLSAATHHGAAPRQPDTLHVMVDSQTANQNVGSMRLRFYTHARVGRLAAEQVPTPTGSFLVASPAVTSLDLAARPHLAGDPTAAGAVIREVVAATGLEAPAILDAAQHYPASCLRRLGWLAERARTPLDLDAVAEAVDRQSRPDVRPSALADPRGPRRGRVNARWGLIENNER